MQAHTLKHAHRLTHTHTHIYIFFFPGIGRKLLWFLHLPDDALAKDAVEGAVGREGDGHEVVVHIFKEIFRQLHHCLSPLGYIWNIETITWYEHKVLQIQSMQNIKLFTKDEDYK